MSRESFVFVLGFIVFVTPFLGIPRGWKDGVCIVSGAAFMLVGFLLRRSAYLRSLESDSGTEREGEEFAEHIPTVETVEETVTPETLHTTTTEIDDKSTTS